MSRNDCVANLPADGLVGRIVSAGENAAGLAVSLGVSSFVGSDSTPRIRARYCLSSLDQMFFRSARSL